MSDPQIHAPLEEPIEPIHIDFQGRRERAEEISFETTKDAWSSYQLADGSVIKLKNVVSRILKLLDKQKDDGTPFYVVEGSAILTTVLPSGENRSTENPASAR